MLSIAAPALADPVTITGGSIFYSRQSDALFDFEGDGGFRARGNFGNDGGWYPGYVCFSCEPGTEINVSHSEALTSSDKLEGVGGRFELEGVLYEIESLQFDVEAGKVTVVSGFTDATSFLLQGMMTGTPVSGGGSSVQIPLVASGNARLLFGSAELDHGWFQSSYRFADPAAPIPEPGTLLLFGTGAVAAIARRRKRANEPGA